MSKPPSPLLTLAAGLALGVAATLYCRRAQQVRAWERIHDWVSDYRKQPDGTIAPDDLVDGAGEDSFPASDPPSFSGNRSR